MFTCGNQKSPCRKQLPFQCTGSTTEFDKLRHDLNLLTKQHTKHVLETSIVDEICSESEIVMEKQDEEEESKNLEEENIETERMPRVFVPQLRPLTCSEVSQEKSVEIRFQDGKEKLVELIRENVKIFGIDFFLGTNEQNEELLATLKDAALGASHILGAPIPLLTYAKITPKKLCTGFLKKPESSVYLEGGSEVVITTDRRYSARCTSALIYMNTRAQMACIGVTDVVSIGKSIQLKIVKMIRGRTGARCTVQSGGYLHSQMPVYFPYFCKDYTTSVEEVDDMTLAMKMDIDVLVAPIKPDNYSKQFEVYRSTVELCEKPNTKIYARIFVTDFGSCDFIKTVHCMLELYHGFLLECYGIFSPHEKKNINEEMISKVRDFMQMCFKRRKPVILEEYWLKNEFQDQTRLWRHNWSPDQLQAKEKWYEYFKGNRKPPLKSPSTTSIMDTIDFENNNIVEINADDSMDAIIDLIRSNVKIFAINMIYGSLEENAQAFLRIKMAELHVSHELNRLVSHEIYVKLSPREPHTGNLKAPTSSIMLEEDASVTLTMNRKYVNHCTSSLVYISGRLQFGCINKMDIIEIGGNIQLQVLKLLVKEQAFFCRVLKSGKLKSHMVVKLPNDCTQCLTSTEEIEDILLATSLHVNTLIAYKADSIEYCHGLRETLNILKCSHIKLYARVLLSEFKKEVFNTKVDDLTRAYDGFIMEYDSISKPDKGITETKFIEFLETWANQFVRSCEQAKKPIALVENDIKYNFYGDENESILELVKRTKLQFCHESTKSVWLGAFEGYQVLPEKDPVEPLRCGNRKAIKISFHDTKEAIMNLMRSQVNTFEIDLSFGYTEQHESLVLRIKEAQLLVGYETGTPISSAIYVILSPRYPSIGHFLYPDNSIHLKVGNRIILTTDRRFSISSTPEVIYISARFQMTCVLENDVITIGKSVQVKVDKMIRERLSAICTVVSGGCVRPGMQVKLSEACENYRNYAEELEDMTFAMAMGIDVVVTRSIGSQEYFDDLMNIIDQLIQTKLRVYARVTLNDLENEAYDEILMWAAESYDGFLLEYNNPCPGQIIKLSKHISNFMQICHNEKKPIILGGNWSDNSMPLISPSNHLNFFYFPDKYVLNRDHDCRFLGFCEAMFDKLSPEYFCRPFTDQSFTGSDTFARAVAAASFDLHAGAIVICSLSGRMATKVAHFRPRVPIILVSNLPTVASHVLLCHNIWFLHFSKFIDCGTDDSRKTLTPTPSHIETVIEQLLMGLDYAQKKKFIRDGHKVILVFRKCSGTGLPDNYICFKFNRMRCAKELHLALNK